MDFRLSLPVINYQTTNDAVKQQILDAYGYLETLKNYISAMIDLKEFDVKRPDVEYLRLMQDYDRVSEEIEQLESAAHKYGVYLRT